MSGSQPEDAPPPPALRVVRGDATPEEVAALLVVLQALVPAASDAPAPRSEWAAPRRLVRAPLTAGRDAWRASALPG